MVIVLNTHTPNKKIIKSIILIFVLAIICLSVDFFIKYVKTDEQFYLNVTQKGLTIANLELISQDDDSVNVKIILPSLWISKKRYIFVSNSNFLPSMYDEKWIEVNNNECILNLNESSKYIFIKDSKNISNSFNVSDYINLITNIKVYSKDCILYIGDTLNIDYEISKIGYPDETIKINTDNNDVIQITDNTIIGLKNR